MTPRRLSRFPANLLGTLRSNDADGEEKVKKKKPTKRFYKQNKNFARFFVHFFPRFCTTTKMPNFAFYGGQKQATAKFYFSF